MELLSLLSANEIVAQIACFLVLFFILRVVLWRRVLGSLDARKEAIAGGFRHIEDTKAILSNMKADYEGRLAKIDEEAEARAQAALAEARVLGEQIRLRAEMDADKIHRNARDSIRDDLARAEEELKDTIVDLTIDVTEKVIQERLTENGDRKLIERFIDEVSRK